MMSECWLIIPKALAALAFAPSLAFAGAGITYHGRLMKPDGTPVVANPVKFKIQLRTPGAENCLMYQETHALDLSSSDGVFAVTVNDGTATVVNTEPFSLDRVFQNRGTFAFAGGKCGTGNSYAPNPTDGRKIVVEFDDGTTGGWEPLPAQTINFVPMAMESLTLGGYGSGSMLRVNDGTGAPASVPALTQTQYNSFVDLLAGSSSLYLTSSSALNGSNLSAGSVDDTKLAAGITGSKISGNISGNAAGFTGSLTGDVTGTQSATVVGKIQGRAVDSAAPTNGQVLKWSSGNSRWEPSADSAGAGTVTSVTGTGAVVMTGTAADPIVGVQTASTAVKGVVQLASSSDVAANLVVQSNDSRLTDARAPTAHHHNVDEVDSAAGKYLSYKPNNTQCADGQVLKWIVANQRWECGTDAGSAGTVASLTVNAPIVKTGTVSDPIISVQDASTSQKGAVQLAASSDTTAGLAVQANDTRLTDARTPTTHTHVVDQITSAVGKYFGYLPNNAACADGQLLKWNLAQTRWECGNAASSEATTASNVGSAGVGVFKQLSTYDLQLKKINPTGAVTITDDTGNSKIDVGLNLGGVFTNNTGLIVSDGTQLLNKACSANQILKWLSPTGWTCAADDGLTVESDPKVGANTTNYASKWNGTALVASGIFESGGSVGIGTSSPASNLHVESAADTGFVVKKTSGSSFYVTSQTGTSVLGTGSATDLEIRTGNTERMRILSTGNIGIGTNNPGAKLDLQGSSGTTLKIVDGNQANGKVLTSDANGVASWQTPSGGGGTGTTMVTNWPDAIRCYNGAGYYNLPAVNVPWSDGKSYYQFSTLWVSFNSDGTYYSHSNMGGYDCVTNGWSISQLYSQGRAFNLAGGGGGNLWTASGSDTFYGGGKVGIGTTSPVDKLHVAGAIHTTAAAAATTGSGEAFFDFIGGSTGRIQVMGPDNSTNGAFQIQTYRANATNSLTPFYISNAGNVGIGTTTPSSILQTLTPPGFAYSLPATSGATQTGANTRMSSAPGATLDFGTESTGKQWIQATNTGNLSFNYALLLNPNGGNVGIGTTSPTSKLDVAGTVTATQYSGLAATSNFQRVVATLTGAVNGGSANATCPAGYTLISWGLVTDLRTQSGLSGWDNGGTLACTGSGNTVTVTLSNYSNGSVYTTVECQGLCARN